MFEHPSHYNVNRFQGVSLRPRISFRLKKTLLKALKGILFSWQGNSLPVSEVRYGYVFFEINC